MCFNLFWTKVYNTTTILDSFIFHGWSIWIAQTLNVFFHYSVQCLIVKWTEHILQKYNFWFQKKEKWVFESLNWNLKWSLLSLNPLIFMCITKAYIYIFYTVQNEDVLFLQNFKGRWFNFCRAVDIKRDKRFRDFIA